MKPQQRSFVVEYKSARRRSAPQANVIWGNMDLNTLVREAEVDAPHLFVRDDVSQPTMAVSFENQTTVGSGALSATITPVLTEPDLASAIIATLKQSRVVAAISTVATVQTSTAALAEESSRRLRRNASPMVTKTGEEVIAGKNSEDVAISLDELAALESENRQLTLSLSKLLKNES